MESRSGRAVIVHERTLGHLHRQCRRRQTGAGENFVESICETTVGDLANRDIDRKPDSIPALKIAIVAASSVHHPVADRHDQPALLGDRYEDRWRNSPTLGISPAQQCLRTKSTAVGEPDDWLIRDAQLACPQREPESASDRETVLLLTPHVSIVQA